MSGGDHGGLQRSAQTGYVAAIPTPSAEGVCGQSAARSSAIGGAAKISQVAPSVQHLCIYKAESAAGQAPLTYISTS